MRWPGQFTSDFRLYNRLRLVRSGFPFSSCVFCPAFDDLRINVSIHVQLRFTVPRGDMFTTILVLVLY